MANDIKSKLHDIPIVLGGNHASNNAKEILSKESSIDYIIAGEADYTFLDFLEKYFNKDMNPGDAIIFDENGIHKGSKILENERIVLRFLFSPNHKN